MLTKLPEIAQRLANFYGNKYGPENLVIIKDSKQVKLLCIIFIDEQKTKVIQLTVTHAHTQTQFLQFG